VRPRSPRSASARTPERTAEKIIAESTLPLARLERALAQQPIRATSEAARRVDVEPAPFRAEPRTSEVEQSNLETIAKLGEEQRPL